MNEQLIGERWMTEDVVENTDMNPTTPTANPEPVTDQVPVEAALFHEPPLSRDGFVDVPPARIVHEEAISQPVAYEAPPIQSVGSLAALLNKEESEHFRTQWNEVQSKFVDDPRSAVQQADTLVSAVTEQITRMFSNEHNSLEAQWGQGKDVSTEDLRKALQRYRSFFNRLVV